jgi:uncharacterized protein YqeY
MLIDTIRDDLKTAQKADDKLTVSTLRLVISNLHNAQIAKGEILSDHEIERELFRFAKQFKESIEAYKLGNRPDLAGKEEKELEVLEKYMPSQLSDDEIVNEVKDAIGKTGATSVSDFGVVMKSAMLKLAGRADGSKVSQITKKLLAK